MKKKILLISPSMELSTKKIPKAIRIPEIALSMIAAITPDDFEVEIIEEEVEEIDFDKECDLIGISCMTANVMRAYEIATEFKKRGRTVTFGGIHPTLLPDEALQYGDSVVIGEAEGVWEQLLVDYQNGNLKPKYTNLNSDITNCPLPKRNLTKNKTFFNIKPVLTTKGCPYNCSFCCVPIVFGNKVRHIPINRVVEDIIASKERTFLFLDDNVIGHPKYAKELFRAIIPLKIQWVGQASISFVKDRELMKLAQESGCKGLFFGLETVTKSKLKKMRKNFNEISKIEDAIKKVNDLGILFHSSMVFGFDDDTEAVFDETLEFHMKNKIAAASFNILAPYPRTAIYNQFKEEGRLLTENWRFYNAENVVFKPKNMTPMALAEGYHRVKKEFYSLSSIGKRLMGNLNHPLIHTFVNLAYRTLVINNRTTWRERMSIIIKSNNEEPSPVVY